MSTNHEYFCIAAEGEITFGRMVGETSPLHSKPVERYRLFSPFVSVTSAITSRSGNRA
jgi:hypothetical protein